MTCGLVTRDLGLAPKPSLSDKLAWSSIGPGTLKNFKNPQEPSEEEHHPPSTY